MKNITFINAGAGSGKTYRLTTDLAHKLTQSDLDPSQVILTTYTELAATEFREKARKEILNAKGCDAQTRIQRATQLDNAFIGTVHAISFRFIRKYWYLLDYGADIQPMSDQNQDFYMSQSISNIVTDEDRRVFREFRDAFDIKDGMSHPYHLFWLPELKTIVDKMEYYDISDVQRSIDESYQTAARVFTGMPKQQAILTINKFLPTLKPYLLQLKASDKVLAAIAALDALSKDGTPSISGLEDLETDKENLLSQYGDGRFKAEKQLKSDFYGKELYVDALDASNQIPVSADYLPLILRYLRTIFALAVRWQEALQQYKKENHIISFDDMEKIFLTMLTDAKYQEVQDDIRRTFRLLMVDEFQDSNPIQLKIFNRISELIAERGGESIWVGDPKQAIYGFRGSDSRFIAEILDKFVFSEDGTPVAKQGEEMLGTDQLLESWRSRPALVNFANQIFLEPFQQSGLKEKQITLHPHHTAETDTLGTEQALYVWRTEKNSSDPRARMLAAQIQKLLKSKCHVHHQPCDKPSSEITYRDIAVLCYSNTECNKVASQLRKLGLPASCEETNLMQCLEVYLLKTLLLFVQKPTDKMLRAELAMMLCDATTEEILKDRIAYVNANYKEEEKAWDHWMDADTEHSFAQRLDQLTRLTSRYQNLSVYDAVVAIHEELDLNNLIQKWGDATQRRHNLSSVVSMAKAYDDMCLQMGIGTSILGFINYLTITKPDNKTDNSANTIKVLTYHRSKGLEWPVVILYQLWKDFNDDADLVKKKFRGVNVCEEDDQTASIFTRKHYINLFPTGIGGNGNLPDLMLATVTGKTEEQYDIPLFGTIRQQTREEALRLLYVGVTRAKDRLVAVTSIHKESKNAKWPADLGIGEGESDHPFGTGLGETLIELTESREEAAALTTPQYQLTLNTPALNAAPLLHLSPSTITTFANAFTGNVQAAESDERIIDMKVFAGESSDALKGTCIHNIFAVYRPGDREGNLLRTTQTLENFGFRHTLLAQKEMLLASIQWLYDYLTQAYGPAVRIEQECPLLYQLSTGQMLRGEIDLQWYYRDGTGSVKCLLIDYKTFPGRRDQLEEHTVKYYPQLSAYHAALTAAGIEVTDTLIYYPVQGHVRKLIHI